MTKNLTEGNSLKVILLFSLPILAGNLFQQTYNMADAAIVGLYLGKDALAGVGASSSVQFMILGFCFGICSGFTIPVAQRFGAEDYSSMRQYIFIGFVSLCIFSILTTICCVIFCTNILHVLSTPEDIFDQAYAYLVILFAGIPFSLFYNFLSGILRAAGDSKTPFLILLFSTFLNLILDVIFILFINLGVTGAALATVISQGISGILTFAYIAKKVPILHPGFKERKWDSEKFRVLCIMGFPMGLQFSITAIGSMVLQTANNALGSVYIASFSAASKLKQLLICPCDAFGAAVSTFAGQNYGANKTARLKRGILQGTGVSFIYGLSASFLLFFLGRTMSLMFLKSDEKLVLDGVELYAKTMGLFYWNIGILNVVRPTIQSLGHSRRAVFSGIVEMIARCSISFGLVPALGFKAICMADPCAWICAVGYCVPTLIYVLKGIPHKE